VAGKNLCNGHTTSCGSKKHQQNYHGLTNAPIYHVWENMIARCTNNKHPSWRGYGGRGISVDERWLDFVTFHKDMGGTYQKGLTIDRKDNNAGYCKRNCRWAPRSEQILNTRKTRRVTVGGVTMVAKRWSEKTGIAYSTLLNRLNKGWPHKIAIQP
jgi:hypothetical protein